MLLLEALAEVGDGRCVARGLELAHRVFAAVDPLLQLCRLGPRRRDLPGRELPDGVAALAASLGAVVDDEGPGAVRGDAAAEALHVGVVRDAVALGRGREGLDDGVGEFLRHGRFLCMSASCPSH